MLDYEKIQSLRKRKETLLQGLIENSKTTRRLEEELKEINETLSKVRLIMNNFNKILSSAEHQVYQKHFIEGKNLKVCAEEIYISYSYARILKMRIVRKINEILKEETKSKQ